jgi:hypothetical protein
MVHGVSVSYFYSVRSTANQYEVSYEYTVNISIRSTLDSLPDAALAFTTPFSPRELLALICLEHGGIFLKAMIRRRRRRRRRRI